MLVKNSHNHFLNSFFNDTFFHPIGYKNRETFHPNVDVVEKRDRYELILDIPGVDKKDLEVKLEDGYLTVKGSRKSENIEQDGEGKVIRQEIVYGNFERSWKVDELLIDVEKIKGSAVDGVYTLTLPKTKETQKKSKIIKIE